MKYYLTDFEWLIIFSLLKKPKENHLFSSYFSLEDTKKQLQNLLNLDCIEINQCHSLSLNVSKDEVKLVACCKEQDKLEKWIENYIESYKKEKILFSKDCILRFEERIDLTLKFLEDLQRRGYSNPTIRREIEGMKDDIFCANANSRLFEDLFLLGQYGVINLLNIHYICFPLAPKNVEKEQDYNPKIIVSMMVSFPSKKDKEENSFKLSQIKHIKTDTFSPIEGRPFPYDRFEIKRTNPTDMYSCSIFYEGKKLKFKYNTQEYRLLELLLNATRAVSQSEVIDYLRLRVYLNTRKMEYVQNSKEYNLIRQQRGYDNLKLYCSRVRKLLPKAVTLVLDKKGVYLKKS